ncbi:MAG TPA: hypothetical protein VKX17_01275 [Planctomycetota bacterium]|nr:hypothetical protein [Planctomycetota bacterium]
MSTDTLYPGVESYEQAVQALAEEYVRAHNALGDLVIYYLPDPKKEVVQLIEVSDLFPDSGDIWPVRFRPTSDFPFPTAQIVMTKDEWKRIKEGSLKIVSDAEWDIKKFKKVWPHD